VQEKLSLVSPESFTVKSTFSIASALKSSIRPALSGHYHFNVTLSGSAAADYTLIYLKGNLVDMLQSTAPQPAAIVQSAAFSTDGTVVIVLFDSPTNYANLPSLFTCSLLFTFVGDTSTKCMWKSDYEVNAFVTATISVRPGVVLLLKQGLIKASCTSSNGDCSNWPTALASSVVIQSPASPVVPIVAISAPSSLGPCDALTLDLSGSTGNGGRIWSSIRIVVSSNGPEENLVILQSFLDRTYVVNPPTSIPASMLLTGIVYNFDITLCNFFNVCGQSGKRIVVLANIIPSASIHGQQLRRYATRAAKLALESNAFISLCDDASGGAKSTNNLQYLWQVFVGGKKLLGVNSISKDPSKFYVEAFTLQTYTMYEIKLTVTMISTLQSSTTSVLVYVNPSPIIAIIGGGFDRAMPMDGKLLLDGSKSYDKDVQGFTGIQAGLVYSWSCRQVLPVPLDSCLLNIAASQLNQQAILVQATLQAILTTSIITMQIRALNGEKTAETQVSLKVLNDSAPIISLVSGFASSKLNVGTNLRLDGTISLKGKCRAVWTVDDASVDLDRHALLPTVLDIEKSRSVTMLLPPYTLIAGSELSFALTCTNALGQIGRATVTIITNAPPAPGIFFVDPAEGEELGTEFRFISSMWSDDDLPISYQYGFLSGLNSLMVVQSRSESAFAVSQLPAGSAIKNKRLTCVASVFDSLSANSTYVFIVTVTPKPIAESTSIILAQLNAMNSGGVRNANEMKRLNALAISVVNSVNCTLAPPNCTAINRNPCSARDHTCGSCLAGNYVGENGDNNEPCHLFNPQTLVSSANLTTGAQTLKLSARNLQQPCEISDECPIWFVCDLGGCVRPTKKCLNECNEKGDCLHLDNSGYLLPVEHYCFSGDPSCYVACECHEGFYGDSCGMTLDERDKRASAREMATLNIASLVDNEEPSPDVVESWVYSLAGASSKFDELSENSTDVVQRVSESILRNAIGTGLGYQSMSPVLDALNSASRAKELISSQKTQGRNSSQLLVRKSNNIQMLRITAKSFFDTTGSGFLGRSAVGSFRIGYNGTFSADINCNADAETVHAAILRILPPNLASFPSDVEVTRSYGVHAMSGKVSLNNRALGAVCMNSRLDPCEFVNLPAGDLVRINDLWYRIAYNYYSADSLTLASVDNFLEVIEPYAGPSLINMTLYRWSHGYEWKVRFKGAHATSNPYLSQVIEVLPSLYPASAEFSVFSIPGINQNSNATKVSSNAEKISQVLRLFGDIVANDMVMGQEPIQTIKDQFAMSTQVLDTSNSTASRVQVFIPQRNDEIARGMLAPSVDVPINGIDKTTGLTETIITTAYQLQSSAYEDLGSGFISNPISITFSNMPNSLSDNENGNGRSPEITIVLPNTIPQGYSSEIPPLIETTCYFDDYTLHEYPCSHATSVKTQCNGTAGVFAARCKNFRPAPVCNTIIDNEAVNTQCRVISFDANSVVCGCPLFNFRGQNGRRLLSNSSTGVVISPTGSVSLNYVAMIESVADDFINVWTSVADLNAGDLKKGTGVLIVLGVFLMMLITFIFIANHLDSRDEKIKPLESDQKDGSKLSKEVQLRNRLSTNPKSSFAQLVKRLRMPGSERSSRAIQDLQFIEKSLPSVLSSVPFTTRVLGEMKRFHRWMCVYFHYSPTFPRLLRVMTLTTNVLSTLFLQAVMYNITNPDDGSCKSHIMEETCVAETSDFAYGESKCYWVQGNQKGLCYFREPENSLEVVVFIAILCAVISIPIVVFIDNIIKKILAAKMTRPETSSSLRRSAAARSSPDSTSGLVPDPKASPDSLRRGKMLAHSPMIKRRSVTGSLGFLSYGTNLSTTLQEDLGSCVTKLRAYRATLTGDAQIEFDTMWGFDATGEFHAAAESGARSWLTAISGRKGDVQKRITDDLISVRKSVDEEIDLIRKCANDKERGMRMLLLFQQDLLNGAKGDILAEKGKRNMHVLSERTFGVKLAGWVTVLSLNFLMFAYIILFALQQSQARQGAWAKSFVVWLISEIFFVSTGVCFIMHCMIPLVVMRDLEKCKRKLLDNIRDFKHSNLQDKASEETDSTPFNAASFFFVSHRVAELVPNLRESKIILHFKTQWPKSSYVQVKDVSSSYNSVGQALGRSASMVILQLLGGLVSVGPAIQDAIMELFSTFVVGYTVLIHIRLYNFNVAFVLFPAIVCLLIGHFLLKWNSSSNKLRTLLNEHQKAPAKQNLNKPWKKTLYPGDVGWVEDLERGRSPSVGSGTEGRDGKATVSMPGVDNMYRGMPLVEKLQARQEKSFQKSAAKAANAASPSPKHSTSKNLDEYEDSYSDSGEESSQSSSISSSSSSNTVESSDDSENTTFEAALSRPTKPTVIRPAQSTSAPAKVESLESVTDRMRRMAEQKLQHALAQPVKSSVTIANTAQDLKMQQLQEQMMQMQIMHQKQISMLSAQIGLQGAVPAPTFAYTESVPAPATVAAAGGGAGFNSNITTSTLGIPSPSLGLITTAHLVSAADRLAKSMELKIQAKLAKKKQPFKEKTKL